MLPDFGQSLQFFFNFVITRSGGERGGVQTTRDSRWQSRTTILRIIVWRIICRRCFLVPRALVIHELRFCARVCQCACVRLKHVHTTHKHTQTHTCAHTNIRARAHISYHINARARAHALTHILSLEISVALERKEVFFCATQRQTAVTKQTATQGTHFYVRVSISSHHEYRQTWDWRF